MVVPRGVVAEATGEARRLRPGNVVVTPLCKRLRVPALGVAILEEIFGVSQIPLLPLVRIGRGERVGNAERVAVVDHVLHDLVPVGDGDANGHAAQLAVRVSDGPLLVHFMEAIHVGLCETAVCRLRTGRWRELVFDTRINH